MFTLIVGPTCMELRQAFVPLSPLGRNRCLGHNGLLLARAFTPASRFSCSCASLLSSSPLPTLSHLLMEFVKYSFVVFQASVSSNPAPRRASEKQSFIEGPKSGPGLDYSLSEFSGANLGMTHPPTDARLPLPTQRSFIRRKN